jgi:hypothetical protein
MTIRKRDRQPGAAMPAIPRHHRHPLTSQRMPRVGDFYFCWKPAGVVLQCVTDFKGCFGLDESQVRLYTAIARHTVLVMAALAICAVTAALLRRRTDTRPPAPVGPDQLPPADPGMIPLTVPETGRLIAHPPPLGAAPTGWPGAAATKHSQPDTTSAPGSSATQKSHWSDSKWLPP